MILLQPANTILQTSGKDQAADHIINEVMRNFDLELAANATSREPGELLVEPRSQAPFL
jgi:hypothetical protein